MSNYSPFVEDILNSNEGSAEYCSLVARIMREHKFFKGVVNIGLMLIFLGGVEQVVAREVHNLKVVGATPTPATNPKADTCDECRIATIPTVGWRGAHALRNTTVMAGLVPRLVLAHSILTLDECAIKKGDRGFDSHSERVKTSFGSQVVRQPYKTAAGGSNTGLEVNGRLFHSPRCHAPDGSDRKAGKDEWAATFNKKGTSNFQWGSTIKSPSKNPNLHLVPRCLSRG